MRSSLDCIPCFVSQGLNVARLATADQQVHERVLREVLRRASEADLSQPPARFGQSIHRLVRQLTGQADPYLVIKEESNRLALALLPDWQKRLRAAGNPGPETVKLAIAANVIDFGIKGDMTPEQIPAALEASFAAPLEGDTAEFFAAAERARDILFLADNAGELVFDRLLLELLPREKITVVVKGGPAINDALRADAQVAGLEGLVAVMDTGCDGAGIVLEACSPEFQRRFAQADLIIAKGQANFESLDGCEQRHFLPLQGQVPRRGPAYRPPGREPGLASQCSRGGGPCRRTPQTGRELNATTENNHERKDKVMTPMGDGTGPFGQGPTAKAWALRRRPATRQRRRVARAARARPGLGRGQGAPVQAPSGLRAKQSRQDKPS